MKYLLIICTIFLLINCEREPKKTVNTFDKTEYQTAYVGFLDKTVYIPKGFEAVTIAAYRDSLQSQSSVELSNNITESLYKLELLTDDYMLFVNNDNLPNSIFIQGGEYVDFDPNMAAEYIVMLKNQMEQNALIGGYNFSLLEKNFTKGKNSKIIKVKFLKDFIIEKVYITQYLITNNNQTFSIVISTKDGEDYEEVMKRI